MNIASFLGINDVSHLKPLVFILGLAILWTWETRRPFFDRRPADRLRHAGRNLTLAAGNAVLLGLCFGGAVHFMAERTALHGWGLLNRFEPPSGVRLVAALVLLDAWLYVWHRLNHRVPLLWNFHRVHHSDDAMDATTAVRFHTGEMALSALLRLLLIPLLGLEMVHIFLHEAIVTAITLFHHADISLGPGDAPLRRLLVTPDLHKVHHSQVPAETNSNYAVLLSAWDRMGGTYREPDATSTLRLGLDDIPPALSRTLLGLLRTPFVRLPPARPPVEPP